jgi:hypothetical protein
MKQAKFQKLLKGKHRNAYTFPRLQALTQNFHFLGQKAHSADHRYFFTRQIIRIAAMTMLFEGCLPFSF